MKTKHKLKRGLALLLAGGLALTNLGTALPAFAEESPATPETAASDSAETEETAESAPDLAQIADTLYNDLPDAPTGSYLGSMGLPVATGETKISISAWTTDLYDGEDAHLDADALQGDTRSTATSMSKVPTLQERSSRNWKKMRTMTPSALAIRALWWAMPAMKRPNTCPCRWWPPSALPRCWKSSA